MIKTLWFWWLSLAMILFFWIQCLGIVPFKISPRYLRCLLTLDWGFGLNNKISVLLAFNDILLALSQKLSHDWCAYLSFSVICQTIVGLYYLQNDVHHYIWLLCWSHLCRWGTVKDPRQIPEGLHNWDIDFLKRNCLLFSAVAVPSDTFWPLEFSSPYAIVIQIIK